MEDFLHDFWWLLFPLAFFVFGAWDRWLSYRRSRDRIELLRAYTSQGRDPPPELLRALEREEEEDDDGPDAIYVRGDRLSRRLHRRYWRHSPYWAWRTTIVTSAVAAGFWFAAEYADMPGVDWSFKLVAIIMTVVAAGHLVAAIFASTLRGR